MKAIRIKNAKQSFAMFLMAMNQRFLFDYGEFVITETGNIAKFREWSLKNGVRQEELDEMSFEVIYADIDVEY